MADIGVGKSLIQEQREYILSRQLIRSATSIGANVEEASGGQSRADFYAKITIAYKEARETSYWIRLLRASGYLSETLAVELLEDVDEIMRIIGSIQVTVKNQIRSGRAQFVTRHS
ncbi:MAG TPA: four helix bundle protein [Fibrobacteria bacterium]|nr:four helix bundle protein [Fibrobacteria bacterium]